MAPVLTVPADQHRWHGARRAVSGRVARPPSGGSVDDVVRGEDKTSQIMSGSCCDVYTDVEKTMIGLQRQALVRETRSAFQQAMERRFIGAVERLTGRRVVRFISAHHVGQTDLELELFMLER
jgi:hypothetical protein